MSCYRKRHGRQSSCFRKHRLRCRSCFRKRRYHKGSKRFAAACRRTPAQMAGSSAVARFRLPAGLHIRSALCPRFSPRRPRNAASASFRRSNSAIRLRSAYRGRCDLVAVTNQPFGSSSAVARLASARRISTRVAPVSGPTFFQSSVLRQPAPGRGTLMRRACRCSGSCPRGSYP